MELLDYAQPPSKILVEKNAKIDVICKDCLATSSTIFLQPPFPGNYPLISAKFKNQNAKAQRKT